MVGNGAQGSVQDVRAAALELPSNWTTVWSQSKKQIYYFNTATSESTWILPGAQAADQDPGEWAHVLSESKKKYYWFNTLTGESVWEQPDAATTTACRDQDSTKNAIPLKQGCTGLQLSEGWPHAVAGGHTSVVDKKFLPPDASGYSNPPIMLGDRIVEVDSEDASQLTSADVLRKLAGPINSTVEIKLSRKTGAERYRVCLLRQSALVQSTSDQSTLANRPSTPRVRTLQPSTPRGSPHTSDALEQTHPDRENSSTDRKNAVNDNQGLSVDITLKLGLSFSVVGRERSAERKAFVTGLKGDLADALDLPSTCFHIVSLAPGSVIAHAQINADPQRRGPKPEEAWSLLSKQADDLNSRLRRGMFTRYTEAVARVARPKDNERHEPAACNEDPYVLTEDVTLRRGESGSVGLQFYQPSCPGPCIIVGLLQHGPAAQSGSIQAGDHLVALDGRSVTRQTVPEISQLLRGEFQSLVVLTVARPRSPSMIPDLSGDEEIRPALEDETSAVETLDLTRLDGQGQLPVEAICAHLPAPVQETPERSNRLQPGGRNTGATEVKAERVSSSAASSQGEVWHHESASDYFLNPSSPRQPLESPELLSPPPVVSLREPALSSAGAGAKMIVRYDTASSEGKSFRKHDREVLDFQKQGGNGWTLVRTSDGSRCWLPTADLDVFGSVADARETAFCDKEALLEQMLAIEKQELDSCTAALEEMRSRSRLSSAFSPSQVPLNETDAEDINISDARSSPSVDTSRRTTTPSRTESIPTYVRAQSSAAPVSSDQHSTSASTFSCQDHLVPTNPPMVNPPEGLHYPATPSKKEVAVKRGRDGKLGIKFVVVDSQRSSEPKPHEIEKLAPGGAAAESRCLFPGDLVHAIDGNSIEDLDTAQLLRALRGAPEATVRFTVSRRTADVPPVAVYLCDGGCGFRGSFHEVASHESGCEMLLKIRASLPATMAQMTELKDKQGGGSEKERGRSGKEAGEEFSKTIKSPTSVERQGEAITVSRGPQGSLGIRVYFDHTVQGGTWCIHDLIPEGTAHKCGLFNAGMLIHAIDGTEIRTLSMDQVVALLKGQPGSTVSVTVSSHLMAFQSSAISPSSFSEEAKDAVVERFKQLVMNKDFEGLIAMEPELVDLSSSILDQHPDLRQMSVKLTAGVLCKCNVITMLSKLAEAYRACERFTDLVRLREMLAHCAIDAGDQVAECQAWLQVCDADILAEKYGDALDALKLASHIAEDMGDEAIHESVLARTGLVQTHLLEYDLALKSFEEYLTIVQVRGSTAEEAIALGHIANVFFLMEKYDDAIGVQKQHLDKVMEIKDQNSEAMIYCNIGICCDKLGRHKDAVYWHQKHLDTAEALQDLDGQGTASCNLGAAYTELGDSQQALVMHMRHLSISRELGDTESELLALGHLASIHGNQPQQAQAYLEESITVAQKIGDSLLEARLHGKLGLSLVDGKELARAQQHFESQLRLMKQLGDVPGITRACARLGNVLHDLGNFSKALDLFLEHLEISTQAKDMLEVARAHRNIGRIFQVQGHHERALDIHRKYLAIARQISNAEEEATALRSVRESLRLLGLPADV